MPQIESMEDNRVVAPTETALAIKLLTEVDLLRLKTIARLHARGLPPHVSWEDLLQEAISRVLIGARRKPDGVALVAFFAGVMRSLRTDHWRRALGGSGHALESCDPAPDPERALMAVQELAAIEQLFAKDAAALRIIGGLAKGLSAEQIRAATGLSKLDYDSTRRRMRRLLLREGLTSCPGD